MDKYIHEYELNNVFASITFTLKPAARGVELEQMRRNISDNYRANNKQTNGSVLLFED